MRRRTSKTALRVVAYVKTNWNGSTRAAALALGVDHTSLWRTMTDKLKHPSAKVILALADHSKQSTDYWYGRTEE